MNVLDLFSGVGGFALGLERAGMRTVAFCERDRFCRDVLRKHWPHVPCFDDVRALDAARLGRLGRIDLVTGGFPCQPFSVAGDQKGAQDDRHLWPEMRRVIALSRPAWVLGENVAGIIPMALDDVLADLEGLGYAARTFVIPACAVDAPHRRDRVWIIAADPALLQRLALEWNESDGAVSSDEVSANAASDGREQGRSSTSEDVRESGGLCDGDAFPVSNADGDQHKGHTPANGRSASPELSATHADSIELRHQPRWSDGPHGPDPSESGNDGDAQPLADADLARQQERAQQHVRAVHGEQSPSGDYAGGCSGSARWSPEPNVGRVAHGVPRRVDRLRALGNAVVPQLVEELGRAILMTTTQEQARQPSRAQRA